jgi:hemolysin activation/secretion protein
MNKLSTSNLYDFNNGININLIIGKRKTSLESINQLKLHFSAFANLQINYRVYLAIKNESGLLTSKNYLLNEFFRIGGANSFRGYNEQSIFTNGYSYSNVEFRYLLDRTSYLYSITDLGAYKESTTKKIKKLLGIGVGYQFKINNNFVNLGYVISTNSRTNTKLNNSRLVIKWTSFF